MVQDTDSAARDMLCMLRFLHACSLSFSQQDGDDRPDRRADRTAPEAHARPDKRRTRRRSAHPARCCTRSGEPEESDDVLGFGGGGGCASESQRWREEGLSGRGRHDDWRRRGGDDRQSYLV